MKEKIFGRISRDDCSHRGLKWSAVAIGLDVEPDPHFEPAEEIIVSITVFFKTAKRTINLHQTFVEKNLSRKRAMAPRRWKCVRFRKSLVLIVVLIMIMI